jgi:hypothetical protein
MKMGDWLWRQRAMTWPCRTRLEMRLLGWAERALRWVVGRLEGPGLRWQRDCRTDPDRLIALDDDGWIIAIVDRWNDAQWYWERRLGVANGLPTQSAYGFERSKNAAMRAAARWAGEGKGG